MKRGGEGRGGWEGGRERRVGGREGREDGIWKEWRKRGEDSFVMAPHAK